MHIRLFLWKSYRLIIQNTKNVIAKVGACGLCVIVNIEKEEADKRLLHAEIVIGVAATLIFLDLVLTSILTFKYAGLPLWAMIVMLVVAAIIFFGGCFFALRIEQKAGYYECKECGYKYVPSYKAVMMAPHMGRSRYMKCPHCGKKSYHKKVLNNK